MCVLQLIATSCPAAAKQSRTLWLFLLLLLLLLPSLFWGDGYGGEGGVVGGGSYLYKDDWI